MSRTIQIGRSESPAVVIQSGEQSDFGKRSVTIYVALTDNSTAQEIQDFEKQLQSKGKAGNTFVSPLMKSGARDGGGRAYDVVKFRVNQQGKNGEEVKIPEAGDLCLVAVEPRPWQMGKKEGYYLPMSDVLLKGRYNGSPIAIVPEIVVEPARNWL